MSDTRLQIERLRVQNYRVLRDVTFKDLTPLTVLCGANGSGKSTVFDVFAFLHEALTGGLRSAWDDRNRIDAIRSRGYGGPVSFEIAYRAPDLVGQVRLVTYTLKIDQEGTVPVIVSEKLRWSVAPGPGRPTQILNFSRGSGSIYDEESGSQQEESLASSDLLAVSALGQLRSHPRVKLLRDFIQGWYLSYVSAGETRSTPRSGPEPRLTRSGDNLANVIQYLEEEHPDRLARIFELLSERVPKLESVTPQHLEDGRLLLRLKDRPFKEPVLSRFASDGTLKLLAYLTVLHGPTQPEVIGIEEPENQLHPFLVPILGEEIREVSGNSQVLVTTHSPEFLSGVRPKELWMLSRADDGFTVVRRVSDEKPVVAMVEAGATLGALWSEGYLADASVGDL
ncbi:AAA family ATPase [soil metagenome]